MTDLDQTLAALADPSRRSAIELLRRKPRRAGELAQALGLSFPAMSRHLRILRQNGLVEESALQNDARVRVYQLRPEPFAELERWIADVQSFWAGELSAFKKHAECTRAKPKVKA